MECAWWHATSGRPGPVWINIPLDVQSSEFDENEAPGFEPPQEASGEDEFKAKVAEAVEMFRAAKRPVLIGGNGIHLCAAEEKFISFVNKTDAPVLLTVGGVDLLEENHPRTMGRFGPLGQRRANFALQNSDLVLSIGASMSVSSIGFNTSGFAPKAKRIMVSVDIEDLLKSNYKPDLGIAADAGRFMDEFLKQTATTEFKISSKWDDACVRWKERYPTVTEDYLANKDYVNSYYFSRRLSNFLPEGAVVVTGNSLDFWSVFQSFEAKANQRIYTNINYGSMGWDLPAVIGAAVGRPDAVVCIPTGDGSIQFNLQELLTIRLNNLPIKIFVLNNLGYESIRSTQNNFFERRHVGSDFTSGIGNPDFSKLAAAYGFGYDCINTNDELHKIEQVLKMEGPVLCELKLSPDQPRSPKTMSVRKPDGTMESRPIEDLFPFLPREEVYENMHLFDGE